MRFIGLSQFIIGVNGTICCEHVNKPRGYIYIYIYICTQSLAHLSSFLLLPEVLAPRVTQFLFEIRTQIQQNSGPLTENRYYLSPDEACTLLLPLRQHISLGVFHIPLQ